MSVTECGFDFQIQDADSLNFAALTFQAQSRRKRRRELSREEEPNVVYATTRGFAAKRGAAAFFFFCLSVSTFLSIYSRSMLVFL